VASAHHVPEGSPSGINGHDLALGSGSIDGVVAAASSELEALFTTVVGAARDPHEGAYRYQYGDETNWFVGVGGYVLLDHDYTLTLQTVTSGKYLGDGHARRDQHAATRIGDVDVGRSSAPGMTRHWGTSFLRARGDLPVRAGGRWPRPRIPRRRRTETGGF
jgi:hypothetical protein